EQHAGRRGIPGEVAHREIAEGQQAGVDARMKALGETRFAPVGRAQRMPETRHPADVMAAGPGAERDRLGAELRTYGEQAVADLVERFVPRDPLPLARTARTQAPQRMAKAVRMVDEVERYRPDWAETAVVERRVGIALDLGQPSVGNVQQHAASTVA